MAVAASAEMDAAVRFAFALGRLREDDLNADSGAACRADWVGWVAPLTPVPLVVASLGAEVENEMVLLSPQCLEYD